MKRVDKAICVELLGLAVAAGLKSASAFLALLCITFATLVFAFVALQRYRNGIRAWVLARPDLPLQEFFDRFFSQEHISPEVVAAVREMISHRFARLGGSRFWPTDRLDEDLHLIEIDPTRIEDLWCRIMDKFQIDEDDFPDAPLDTIGDVYTHVWSAIEKRQLHVV